MPRRVENIVRKGEIACYKQFLLFSQCFPQLCILTVSNAALCGDGLKGENANARSYLCISLITWSLQLTLYCIDTHFDASATAFEILVGKGEIAGIKQFLLFPQCFQLNQTTVSPFVHIFDIISLFAVELEEPKIGISGKGLMIPV